MYQWIQISNRNDFDQLIGAIENDYSPENVADRLKSCVTNAVRGILIESDYIDKDYRSTYYNYYSKKGRTYRQDCYRIHFFDGTVHFDDKALSLITEDNELEDHYFGFMVLRPTFEQTIGRTVLSPDIRVGAQGAVITARHRVHLLGHRLHIWGFPWMSQHADIAVCAHVACWAVLRHYSQRFGQYREVLLHQVTTLAGKGDVGGLLPSAGLIETEAETIFRAAGSFPILEGRQKKDPESFSRHALAYLESGFPLYLTSDDLEHAVVLVGHSWKGIHSSPSTAYAWDGVDSLLIVDDNSMPYQTLPLLHQDPGSMSFDKFNWFIVALPEKIHYSVHAIEDYAKTLFSTILRPHMALPDIDDVVIRYFITTAAGLREDSQKFRSAYGDVLVNVTMLAPMAQFVWVIEYATKEQWASGNVCARAIVDATATIFDPVPVWFAHDTQTVISFDRGLVPGAPKIAALSSAASVLPRIERNLRTVVPKP